jgi:Uma2 family endonuclease
MTQSLPKIQFHTIDEFIEWYPENSINHYELHKGIIFEMPPPRGKHEAVIGFLTVFLGTLLSQIGSQYRMPNRTFVKTPENDSLYNPDILIQDYSNVKNEALWGNRPILCQASSMPLVIEVVSQCVARVPRVEAADEPVRVSTNWQDDYYHKFADYEKTGIPEYWIVDFKAFGGRKFIGNPKQPTIFVCELVEGEYQMTPYRGNSPIKSLLFPNLDLTAQQTFDSALS